MTINFIKFHFAVVQNFKARASLSLLLYLKTVEAPKGKTVNVRFYTIEKMEISKFKASLFFTCKGILTVDYLGLLVFSLYLVFTLKFIIYFRG